MNSVLKGDTFEQNSYELLKQSINNDELGISPKYAKVFLKKGYFSQLRNKEIIFDLAIEIWPPNSERYTLLYLIECKSYSTKDVPVDDIEEFLFKASQIANHGYFIKAAFISNSSFQEGAVEIAKNAGLMLIEVTSDKELTIKLHKTVRIKTDNSDDLLKSIQEIESFIFNVFELNKVIGLHKYKREDIANIASNLIEEIDSKVLQQALQIPIEKTIDYLKNNYKLNFNFDDSIFIKKGLLGYYDIPESCIHIDSNIYKTERFAFILAHEVGHFILHKDIKINQQSYDKFEDSEYDFISDKHLLNNHKNWIEWQANEFAASFILPKSSFYTRLVQTQRQLGISRVGFIYLDDQPINRQDFYKIISTLSQFFGTTMTSVIFKLENLNLITYDRKIDDYKSELRSIYNHINGK
ncbi:MAG: ImmA/IrrE family metallo-endopeptidase [Ferruginibacter sp.]